MQYKAKVLLNRKNNQFSLVLNKKKIKILKKRIPKFIKIKGMEFEF
jgi:hypothetical protein